MSKKKLIINYNSSEVRIALLQDKRVSELFIERQRDKGLVGNIYKGKVLRILPGMQSSFIDIGLDRAAFLFAGDVIDPEHGEQQLSDDDDATSKHVARLPIEKLLKQGQEIVVQVTKDPIGTKGPRVTMFLALPGRYLVLVPDSNQVAISRRIEDPKKRDQLKKILAEIKPKGLGVIIRTAANDKVIERDSIDKDLKYLAATWKGIKTKFPKQKAPALLYSEPDLHLKITREIYTDEVTQIVLDDKKAAKDLRDFLNKTIPGAAKKVTLYQKPNPIFDEYEIEFDIAKALNRKVWLPSGGYLVIDQTEALTSFDVNTGKFVGKLSAKDTILKTNLEAVHEIASQIRLRNIGGIIILDLIDMEDQPDRDKVFDTLEKAMKEDKAKSNILKINELGLIQMTRKRTSESLGRKLTETCIHCDGLGYVRSMQTTCFDLIREVERHCLRTKAKKITIRIRNDLRAWLLNEERQLFNEVCKRNQVTIRFVANSLNRENLKEPPYELKQDA